MVYFNGEVLSIPGAYSAIDTSLMATKNNGGSSETVAIIGECTGGEPRTVQWFDNPIAARKVLKSGELLKACEKAWNPVSQSKIGVALGGANRIAVIRSNNATKASLDIKKMAKKATDTPQLVETGFAKTASDANAAFRALGRNITTNADQVFYIAFDRDLTDSTHDHLITLEIDEKTYGIQGLLKDRHPDDRILYFTIKQVDFVDGTPKEGDEAAQKDLSDFTGKIKVTVYLTEPQVAGVYPHDLVQLSQSELDIASGATIKSTVEAEMEEQTQITFQSKDWGAAYNVQIKMGDAQIKGLKYLMVYDELTETYESISNIGNCFTIEYIGDQKYADVSIEYDAHLDMYLVTRVGEDALTAHEDIRLQLNSDKLKSMNGVIQELKAYENYRIGTDEAFNYRLKPTDFDLVTRKGIKSSPYRLTAIYADMGYKLDVSSQMVQVESYDKRLGEIDNFDYQQLTGGKEGVSPASWVTLFDMLSNYDITYIVPLTSDEAIHAELAAHVQAMSGSLGKERRGIVGGNNGETVNETVMRASALASDRMQIVHGGFYDVEIQAGRVLYPPYILAAQHAGRAAFLEGGESATHDVYRMSAPEYKLERDEITQLLAAGCLAFEFVLGRNNLSQSYTRLVQDLTTDVISQDTVHNERATGALADSINKEIRAMMESMIIGKRMTTTDMVSTKNAIISILQNRQRKGHIIAFKDVYVVKEGTVCEIEYMVAPAEPNNFALITAHFYSEPLEA